MKKLIILALALALALAACANGGEKNKDHSGVLYNDKSEIVINGKIYKNIRTIDYESFSIYKTIYINTEPVKPIIDNIFINVENNEIVIFIENIIVFDIINEDPRGGSFCKIHSEYYHSMFDADNNDLNISGDLILKYLKNNCDGIGPYFSINCFYNYTFIKLLPEIGAQNNLILDYLINELQIWGGHDKIYNFPELNEINIDELNALLKNPGAVYKNNGINGTYYTYDWLMANDEDAYYAHMLPIEQLHDILELSNSTDYHIISSGLKLQSENNYTNFKEKIENYNNLLKN